MEDKNSSIWPNKHNIFGVNVSATTYEEALNLIIFAVQKRIPAIVTHLPVHGLILASRDPSLQTKVNCFNIVAPDGQPVRWALKVLFKRKLPDRVYGPELMMRLCKSAAELGIAIYLLGSYPHVVDQLKDNLVKKFPSLQVAGFESPPFRTLTSEEDKAIVERINKSGAGLVFIGLGCPKQDIFAYEHRYNIKIVQLCVGAAFDFIAGEKKMAPAWMQKNALEWLFRLLQEPSRLWRRYFVTNSIFLLMLFLQLTGLKKFQNEK